MGERIRAYDWAKTPLGPCESWPQSLKTAVHIMLTSRYAMWMAWGPELTFICNDAYLPTTGLKRDWVLGARSDHIWAEIWIDIGPRIEHVLATGEATWDEQLLLYLERSGFTEETYHTFSYSPLFDDDGATAGMLCVVNEVTQRVFAERQLAKLRDLGGRLAGASTRIKVMAAFESCFLDDSPDLPFAFAFLGEEGRAQQKLVAAHGLAKTHPAATAQFWLGDRATAPVPSDAFYGVFEISKRPGDEAAGLRAVSESELERVFIAPIGGAEGAAPLGFLVAGLNSNRAFDAGYRGFIELMTGQLAAAVARADEYERERARAEALAELDRAKTVFFSNISHEFRTPLTLMLGPLQDALADSACTPPVQAERIRIAYRNGARLLRLVNALLDFSRIEAGRADASFEPVDLGAMTAELASTFRSACERAGLSLEVDCNALSGEVFVDREMWEKIVLNLLSNAFKFTFVGGIAVRVRENNGNADLEIEDSGIGIAKSDLRRVFERFHRIEGSRGRSFEGSGIGLALVQELVRIHGGALTVESEEGKGTKFRVSLPLGCAHLPAEKIKATSCRTRTAERAQAYADEALRWLSNSGEPEEVVHDLERKTLQAGIHQQGRILLADDNSDLREYVRRLLEASGYSVKAVSDGAAALEAARDNRPDLLLSDIMMPRMDGFALLSAIRQDERLKSLPVIMLSARAGEEAQVEGLTRGADDYLVKPFSARELLARVSGTIAMARVRQRAAEEVQRANDALDIERKFLTCVLAKAPIGISIADRDGKVLTLNERAMELIGQGHAATSAQNYGIYSAIHADSRPYTPDEYPTARAARGETIEGERMICLRAFSSEVDTGSREENASKQENAFSSEVDAGSREENASKQENLESSRFYLNRNDSRDGVSSKDRIALEVDAAPIYDANRLLIGVVTVFKDAGARDKAEEELRQRVSAAVAEREAALSQLHQLAKLETIGQLTGGVAHDFNNLLTPIMGALDFLRRKSTGDERAMQRITSALQAAERSRTLIQRLLAFARRQALEMQAVDVGGLVEGMRDLMQRTLGVGIRLTVCSPPNLPAATVDPNQLELAILNLCVNARDAMGENGSLAITVTEEQAPGVAPGRYIRLTVSDTGCGMDEQTLNSAIEPFFTTKAQGRGTGLGLSMVDGLAAQSGGAFRLSSQVGVGTSASLWLPITDQEAKRIVVGDANAHPATTAAHVLLVDDEEIVREATAEMLTDAGYTVTQAGSAAQALKVALADKRPDIVVADYKMPGMSGVELAQALRAERPNLPVLLITGFANLGERDAAGLPRLAKPFRESEIVARVADLLNRSDSGNRMARILVVEDEPLIAQEIAFAIEDEAGCTVAGVAASVEEALALIDSTRPDGVILDANLNGVSSEKIAAMLRRQNTPFLVLSGYSSQKRLPSPLDEAPFLQKPYRTSELVAHIHGLSHN